ncbi:hypothetical protein RUM43_002234 [Polyplax serrata]|uniref:Uncharacterized protein n=1 Tax=Polyplax serrata TaxID=468196 RepID=A0AAN8PM32_POLSC
MKESKCDQILSDVARGLNPSLRACNQKKSLLFDSLPLMDIILKPPLRPVNPTLFNEGEKKDFKHLIDVMVDFNFNYIQQRAVDGTYSYQLDPNIEELIKFNVGTQTNSRSYSYNLRQIIAHALDLEKMRRSTKGEESEKLPEKTSKEGKTSETQSQTQTYKPATLQPKEIKVKETGHNNAAFTHSVCLSCFVCLSH